MIAAGATLPWVAQISANLLGDEELVDLIAEAGGKWIFIGMESIDPANMADVNKQFSKPANYQGGSRRPRTPKYFRDHVVHFRNGQRHGRRRRPDGRRDRELGAGLAGLRPVDAVPGDAALRSSGESRASCDVQSTGSTSPRSSWPTTR